MPAIELLLIFLVFPILIWSIFTRRARPRWMDFLPLLSVVLAVVDYRLEANPWRMYPAYALVGLVFIFTLPRLLRPSREPAKHPVWSFIGAFLGLFLFVIAAALPVLVPMKTVTPSGPLPVGTVTYVWDDPARIDPYAPEPGQARRLVVQFWYPQEKEAPAGAVSGAQPIYPVVVFSHGGFGLRLSNISTYRELASRGYIVASLDHTYQSIATIVPGSGVILASPEYQALLQGALDGDSEADAGMRQALEIRVADVRFVLDRLERLNQDPASSILSGRLDLARVGLFGHSLGGATAAQVCRVDSRCKAMLDIDGTISGDVTGIDAAGQAQFVEAGFQQPVMFLNSGNLYNDPVYQPGYAPNRSAFDRAVLPAYNLVLAGAEHLNMTDLPLVVSPQLFPLLGERQAQAGSISPERSARIIGAYTAAFFDRYLKELPAPLLEGPSADYPEVTFEARNQ